MAWELREVSKQEMIEIEEYNQRTKRRSDAELLGQVRWITERWPDYKMTTSDGRTFHLLTAREGDIADHIEMRGGEEVSEREREWLLELEGVIHERGSEELPLVFREIGQLIDAWYDLHQASGVEIGEEDRNRLEVFRAFDDAATDASDASDDEDEEEHG